MSGRGQRGTPRRFPFAEPNLQTPITQIGASLAISWRVMAAVGASEAISWRVRVRVGASRAISWRVLGSSQNRGGWKLTYHEPHRQELRVPPAHQRETWPDFVPPESPLRVPVGASLAISWHVKAAVVKSLPISWRVHAIVGVSRPISWRVKALTGASLRFAWAVKHLDPAVLLEIDEDLYVYLTAFTAA